MRQLVSMRLLLALAAFVLLPQSDGATAQEFPPPEPEVPLDVPLPPLLPGDEVVITPDLLEGPSLIAGTAASPEATERIVARLADGFAFCSAFDQREYAVDCVSEQLETIAESLPATGDYAPVRSALADASVRLDAIVAANRSPVLPPVTARVAEPGGLATSRPLRPVATERAEAAIAQAAEIVAETATVLLRSALTPVQDAAFRSVAEALETGTILLRSA